MPVGDHHSKRRRIEHDIPHRQSYLSSKDLSSFRDKVLETPQELELILADLSYRNWSQAFSFCNVRFFFGTLIFLANVKDLLEFINRILQKVSRMNWISEESLNLSRLFSNVMGNMYRLTDDFVFIALKDDLEALTCGMHQTDSFD